jgi:GntR family transcriptional regulator, vanillate catabolism transcriptional regulator
MNNDKRMDTQTARLVVELRGLIMKGELTAGERLVEATLSERLAASRTPVRSALLMLEREGLVQRVQGSGYVVRKYTAREIGQAIAVHANLEAMAARLVAEQGVSRRLSDELQACLDEGDKVVNLDTLDMDAIGSYLSVNTRFHKLIVDACANDILKQCLESVDRIPFASAGGMLPFQFKLADCDEIMRFAQRQHHMLVDALRRGQGSRAAALAEEHRQIALLNLQHATQHNGQDALVPALRLVS